MQPQHALSNRTLFLLGGLIALCAAGGFYLLNSLFLVAYRTPGHSAPLLYGAEMIQDIEVIQDLVTRNGAETHRTAKRLTEHYLTRFSALRTEMDPMLTARLGGYHEKVLPVLNRWVEGEPLSDSERVQLREDMEAMRKLVVLGSQRIEHQMLEERHAALMIRARAGAVLFGLVVIGGMGALLAAWRLGRRRFPDAPKDAVTGVSSQGDEMSRELSRERMLVKRYREMLDSLPAAIVAADAVSGCILFMNATFRTWFGVAENLIGESVATVAAKSGVTFAESGKMSQAGKVYWRDYECIGENAIYVFRDISEQERLANRLINSERLISIGEMASKVTHEIRNPLSTIKMNAEYIVDHASEMSSEELSGAMERIAHEVTRLEEITNRYMGMVRYRADDESSMRAVLPQAITDIVTFHAGEFSRRSIVVEIGSLPQAETALSLGSFREVMLNLLKNAWEELGHGGKVHVTAETRGKVVNLIVEDSGRGIPPADREKVFRNFYTTKPGGTGIGLSHSLKLVTEVGGTITIEESPLGGARFIVTLPLTGEGSHG